MPMPFRPMRRLAVACLVLGLAGLNVATLTFASVHGALSGLVEAMDIRSSRGALVAARDRLAARADRLERRNAALVRDLEGISIFDRFCGQAAPQVAQRSVVRVI